MAKVTRSNPNMFKGLVEKIKEIDGYEAKTGWFETTHYPDGTPTAYVAAIQEFGVAQKNIPPRPFMRPTISQESSNWTSFLQMGAKAILAGNETPYNVLDKVSAKAAGDVAKTISKIFEPPLKEATIKARARKYKSQEITGTLKKPLVDTRLMIDSVTNVVQKSS